VIVPTASSDQVSVYYGVQSGMFERAGLDVTILQVSNGAAAVTAVLGGAAQVGYTNALALASAHTKSIPVVLLAPGPLYSSTSPHAALLTSVDSPLKAPRDLEGRVLAVSGLHDLLGISVVNWLQKNGADASKVKFIEMPPAAMQAALEAKRVDAAAIYEPFLSAAIGAGTAKVFAKPYDSIAASFITGAWFALTPWVNEHRGAAIAVARVLSQASQYVNSHYDELTPVISGFTKLSPETLRTMVKLYTPASLRAADIQAVIDVAARQHEIPNTFPAGDMILNGVP
jgi:NitT/TauT family transport system substrate-binding protein